MLKRTLAIAALAMSLSTNRVEGQSTQPTTAALSSPVVEGHWVRPSPDFPAQPIWGNAEGLRIGIPPLKGPRGLLRVYTPYLGHVPERMINFIAIEPIVHGKPERGYSELEKSKLDSVNGKRFWSAADPEHAASPVDPTHPARGDVETIDGVECLTVFIGVEAFDNGSVVYLRLRFRADKPYEVGIATYAAPASRPLDYCVVTATMGNYARLRELHLQGRVALSTDLWPDYDGNGFTEPIRFPLKEIPRDKSGDAYLVATPDEATPQAVTYHPETRPGWQYAGETAQQYWRMPAPRAELSALVNGRYVYWNSHAPIPGGISFENFELNVPFKQSDEFFFGVEKITKRSTGW